MLVSEARVYGLHLVLRVRLCGVNGKDLGFRVTKN